MGSSRVTAAAGRYTFLSVEQGELCSLPNAIGCAAHDSATRAGWGLNGDMHVGIVILSDVHVLQTFRCWCIVWEDPGVQCSVP